MVKRAKSSQQPPRSKSKREGSTALTTPAPWAPPLGIPSPFAFMRRFAEEMDRMFDDFRFGTSTALPRIELPAIERATAEAAWAPSVEVAEHGGKLVVRVDLPGLAKGDIKVEVRENTLCVEGARRHEREEKRRGFYRSERAYGSFYREIALPKGTDTEQAKASFRNGVLEVTMRAPPKAAKGRRVAIEGS